MSKSTTPDDRIAALEAKPAEIAADSAAKNEALASILRQQSAPTDVISQLLTRLEMTDATKVRERDQKRLEEMTAQAAKRMAEPYRTLLDGPAGFIVTAMEPQKPKGANDQPPPRPLPAMTRFVFVPDGADANVAIGKWEKYMGISDSGIFGLGRYMEGVCPHAVPCTAEEAEPVRQRCLEYIAASDSDKIVSLMIRAGELVIESRWPKPPADEAASLELLLAG